MELILAFLGRILRVDLRSLKKNFEGEIERGVVFGGIERLNLEI